MQSPIESPDLYETTESYTSKNIKLHLAQFKVLPFSRGKCCMVTSSPKKAQQASSLGLKFSTTSPTKSFYDPEKRALDPPLEDLGVSYNSDLFNLRSFLSGHYITISEFNVRAKLLPDTPEWGVDDLVLANDSTCHCIEFAPSRGARLLYLDTAMPVNSRLKNASYISEPNYRSYRHPSNSSVERFFVVENSVGVTLPDSVKNGLYVLTAQLIYDLPTSFYSALASHIADKPKLPAGVDFSSEEYHSSLINVVLGASIYRRGPIPTRSPKLLLRKEELDLFYQVPAGLSETMLSFMPFSEQQAE